MTTPHNQTSIYLLFLSERKINDYNLYRDVCAGLNTKTEEAIYCISKKIDPIDGEKSSFTVVQVMPVAKALALVFLRS